jgi:hypothetical protein
MNGKKLEDLFQRENKSSITLRKVEMLEMSAVNKLIIIMLVTCLTITATLQATAPASSGNRNDGSRAGVRLPKAPTVN